MKNLSMEEIRKKKKTSFMKIIKEKNQITVFEKLTKEKLSHSKVKHVEHSCIIIQKYLLPNSMIMKKEEAQLIFHLRCRVTEVKNNLKGKYDQLECGACGFFEEDQKHILECKVLNRNKTIQDIKYEKIFNGTVAEKLKIARIYSENFAKLEDIKKEKD